MDDELLLKAIKEQKLKEHETNLIDAFDTVIMNYIDKRVHSSIGLITVCHALSIELGKNLAALQVSGAVDGLMAHRLMSASLELVVKVKNDCVKRDWESNE